MPSSFDMIQEPGRVPRLKDIDSPRHLGTRSGPKEKATATMHTYHEAILGDEGGAFASSSPPSASDYTTRWIYNSDA